LKVKGNTHAETHMSLSSAQWCHQILTTNRICPQFFTKIPKYQIIRKYMQCFCSSYR